MKKGEDGFRDLEPGTGRTRVTRTDAAGNKFYQYEIVISRNTVSSRDTTVTNEDDVGDGDDNEGMHDGDDAHKIEAKKRQSGAAHLNEPVDEEEEDVFDSDYLDDGEFAYEPGRLVKLHGLK